MSDRLLVATTNAGKLAEIARQLEGAPVALLSLADLPPIPSPRSTARPSPRLPGTRRATTPGRAA